MINDLNRAELRVLRGVSCIFEHLGIQEMHIDLFYFYLLKYGPLIDIQDIVSEGSFSEMDIRLFHQHFSQYNFFHLRGSKIMLLEPIFSILLKLYMKLKGSEKIQEFGSILHEFKIIVENNLLISKNLCLDLTLPSYLMSNTPSTIIQESNPELFAHELNNSEKVCCKCRGQIDQLYQDVHCNSYCEKCYEEFTFHCGICNEVIPMEDLAGEFGDEPICRECLIEAKSIGSIEDDREEE